MILSLYLVDHLLYTESDATVIYHTFSMLAYFFPIVGSMLADSWLGSFRTILYLSLLYALGSVLLSLSAVEALNLPVSAANQNQRSRVRLCNPQIHYSFESDLVTITHLSALTKVVHLTPTEKNLRPRWPPVRRRGQRRHQAQLHVLRGRPVLAPPAARAAGGVLLLLLRRHHRGEPDLIGRHAGPEGARALLRERRLLSAGFRNTIGGDARRFR